MSRKKTKQTPPYIPHDLTGHLLRPMTPLPDGEEVRHIEVYRLVHSDICRVTYEDGRVHLLHRPPCSRWAIPCREEI